LVVAFVLLPVYYRMQVTSIYHFLGERLGPKSYRTGAAFFIVSRTLGATARLYLVVRILQDVILDSFGVPFWLTAALILPMIVLYTYEGGVKTIVWTDTLQTAGMLTGLVVCTVFLLGKLDLSLPASLARMGDAGIAQVFGMDPLSRVFWLKQTAAGAVIAIAMTGMDQEMMQKASR
jgi:Na+/proline symporter